MAHEDQVTEGREAWRGRAACVSVDPELFFPEGSGKKSSGDSDIALAKAVCRMCPVRESCLNAAMDGRERAGIWGGLTPQERDRLYRRTQRAKHRAATAAAALAAVASGAATAEPAGPVRSLRTGAGHPDRDRIRRGLATGWLRPDAVSTAVARRGRGG